MEGHFTFPCKAVVILRIRFFFVNNRMKSFAIFHMFLGLLCQVKTHFFITRPSNFDIFWKYLSGRLRKIGFQNGKDSSKRFNEHQFLKDKTEFDLIEDWTARAKSYDKLSNSGMNTSQYFDLRQSIETQQISISNSIATSVDLPFPRTR